MISTLTLHAYYNLLDYNQLISIILQKHAYVAEKEGAQECCC